MPRIKMVIEYDGSNYHGLQRQDNAHTIQAELEKQLHHLSGEEVTIWLQDVRMPGYMRGGR